MILQSLVDYYDRADDLAPDGWEWRRIPFFVEIQRDGTFVQLSSQRTGKKPSDVKPSLVPKAEIRSGTRAYEHPNSLWDHVGFVLGYAKSGASNDIENARKQFDSFRSKVERLNDQYPQAEGLMAIRHFYDRSEYTRVDQDPGWPECIKIVGCNLTFRLSGERDLIVQDPALAALAASCSIEQVGSYSAVCRLDGHAMALQTAQP